MFEKYILKDNTLISSKLILPICDGYQHIIKLFDMKRLHDENIYGRIKFNPILDTIEYVF